MTQAVSWLTEGSIVPDILSLSKTTSEVTSEWHWLWDEKSSMKQVSRNMELPRKEEGNIKILYVKHAIQFDTVVKCK